MVLPDLGIVVGLLLVQFGVQSRHAPGSSLLHQALWRCNIAKLQYNETSLQSKMRNAETDKKRDLYIAKLRCSNLWDLRLSNTEIL